jgi:hypothetical protein
MGDFRSFNTADRKPARAMEPVVDPAGWAPESLGPVDEWSYAITASDVDELRDAISSVRANGIAIGDVDCSNFPLRRFAGVLGDVKREITDGRGIVMMRRFPVEGLSREETAIAYIGLGSYLGEKMPQNKFGHVLGHVKDLGGDYADPLTRGYTTRAEMRFHSDGSYYVGLLCLQTPKSGGESRVASSVTVYNRMLEHRPDLVEVLTGDFYRSRSGEINPGEKPWFKQPIFSFTDGYFSAVGLGIAIEKAQALPGVPPFTPAQKEAMAMYRDLVEECAVDIDFRQGDIQFLNNFVMLHTRREYEDWPDPSRKRHLLRLWLTDTDARPIPKEQREGRSARGVRIAGVDLISPLDAEVPA